MVSMVGRPHGVRSGWFVGIPPQRSVRGWLCWPPVTGEIFRLVPFDPARSGSLGHNGQQANGTASAEQAYSADWGPPTGARGVAPHSPTAKNSWVFCGSKKSDRSEN